MAIWSIDPDHSVAAFNIRHLMIARVFGQFNRLSGTIHFDPDKKAGCSLELAIDVVGVHTGIVKRDEHLRSPDFFDAAAFPTITFRSTGFNDGTANKKKLSGQLTIHGITRTIILEAAFSGPVTSPVEIGGEKTLGLSATTTLNREDFGMTWNVPLAGNGVMVGQEIDIRLEIEADLVE